jgi:glycosyltransferase involved in cell wall biosynthesis
MDGGSSDGTQSLLERYEKTYNLRWTSAPDAGMYPAINAGLRRATGQIVAYLNSDDLYFPWTIQTVVRAFQRRPSADFVFGDALAIDDASGHQQMILNPPFDVDFIRRVGFLPQPAVFWRNGSFGDGDAFDERLLWVADCDAWMRVGLWRHFSKVNEFLAIERNHGTTLRESIGQPLWDELAEVRSRYVTPSGPEHDRALRRLRYRTKFWSRFYALQLLLLSFVPRRVRRGPWCHLLNDPVTRLSRRRLFVRAIPWVGRLPQLRELRVQEPLSDSRHWLEPAG